jgi:hypothetical protein
MNGTTTGIATGFAAQLATCAVMLTAGSIIISRKDPAA